MPQAELHANDLHAEVSQLASRVGLDRWQDREAEIVSATMRGDVDWLESRVRGHDHDMMHALCRAIGISKSTQLLGVLRECADDFDEACRGYCLDVLHGSSPDASVAG